MLGSLIIDKLPCGDTKIMEWLSHLVAFVAGLGAGWTMKVVISSRATNSKRTTVVSQKGNRARGDVVAGDKTTKTRK